MTKPCLFLPSFLPQVSLLAQNYWRHREEVSLALLQNWNLHPWDRLQGKLHQERSPLRLRSWAPWPALTRVWHQVSRAWGSWEKGNFWTQMNKEMMEKVLSVPKWKVRWLKDSSASAWSEAVAEISLPNKANVKNLQGGFSKWGKGSHIGIWWRGSKQCIWNSQGMKTYFCCSCCSAKDVLTKHAWLKCTHLANAPLCQFLYTFIWLFLCSVCLFI